MSATMGRAGHVALAAGCAWLLACEGVLGLSGVTDGTRAGASSTVGAGGTAGAASTGPTTGAGGDAGAGSGTAGAPPAPGCGDDLLDPGEECDDGNKVSDDGCSASCTLECDDAVDDVWREGLNCWQVIDVSLTHDEASVQCGALGAGWQLAMLTSNSDQTFIDNQINPPASKLLWTGGGDPDGDLVYHWEDGTPVDDAFYDTGEPSMASGCLVLTPTTKEDVLAAYPCDDTRSALCLRTPESFDANH
jgi:cysteine-rich repeat protein